jgi:hypothetical protein
MTQNDSLIDLENAVIWVVGIAVVLRCRQLSTATAWRYYQLLLLG